MDRVNESLSWLVGLASFPFETPLASWDFFGGGQFGLTKSNVIGGSAGNSMIGRLYHSQTYMCSCYLLLASDSAEHYTLPPAAGLCNIY